jgi:hypothetical protein
MQHSALSNKDAQTSTLMDRRQKERKKLKTLTDIKRNIFLFLKILNKSQPP